MGRNSGHTIFIATKEEKKLILKYFDIKNRRRICTATGA
jgi:hypothetical protein